MSKRSVRDKFYLMYAISIIPLIIFGFYKNGILPYLKGYGSGIEMLKPLILLLMSASGIFIGFLIKEYKTNHKITPKLLEKVKPYIIESLLFACLLPIKTSPIILFAVTVIFGLFFENCKFNRVVLMYILIMVLNKLLGLDSFLNSYEASTTLNYTGLDLFIGFSSGGICSTSVLLSFIGLLLLSFNNIYKKDMVYASIVTFLFLGIVPNMISTTYSEICPLIFGYNILFVLIFIAPNLNTTSYTTKGQILSGVILGIATYFLTLVTPYNAAILSIPIIEALSGIFDRIFVIK